MRILFHYEPGPALARQSTAFSAEGFEVDWVAPSDDARFEQLLPEVQVIWHVLRPLSASEISRARRLRLIQKIGVGVNTIDLEAAKERGIAVCNMPGANARAVAEMTLLLMLSCLRLLPQLDREVRNGGGWRLDPAMQDSFGELAGRTVGFVGYGTIPQTLAPALRALGADLIYTATAPKVNVSAKFVPLEELLGVADIVSLHVPLTSQTNQMINAERMKLLRPSAILINTARGGLVDQSALVAALETGRLSAAGLDVFANEPIPTDEKLLSLDNVVLTPHVGWLTGGTVRRSLDIAIGNCRRLATGAELLYRVV